MAINLNTINQGAKTLAKALYPPYGIASALSGLKSNTAQPVSQPVPQQPNSQSTSTALSAGQFGTSGATGTTPTTTSPAKQSYINNLASSNTTAPFSYNPNAQFFSNPTAPTPSTYNTEATNTTTQPIPKARTGYDDAMQAYIDSLRVSPEEKQAREYLNTLVSQSKQDYEKALGTGETLGFAAGEAARVNKQNQFGIDAASGALGALTDYRKGDTEAIKARLDYEKGLMDSDFDKEKFAEDTRRYGQDYALKERQMAQDAKQSESATKLAQDKFAEDKRQFGLEYAIKQSQLAIDKQKAGGAQVPGQIDATTGSALQLVNSILPKAGTISGKFQSGVIPFTAGSQTKRDYDQLKNVLALGARQLIKGSGAISDYEARMLQDSTNALSRLTSEKDFSQALKNVSGVLRSNAGLPTTVRILQNGKEVDSGPLTREDIYDAAAQGYQIVYE